MAKDDFLWWQRRLKHMAQYFSAYRIDHILGFFRIWEIPGDCTTGGVWGGEGLSTRQGKAGEGDQGGISCALIGGLAAKAKRSGS